MKPEPQFIAVEKHQPKRRTFIAKGWPFTVVKSSPARVEALDARDDERVFKRHQWHLYEIVKEKQ